MNEFIVTIVFIVLLVSGVYFYAGYLTRTGKAEDADGNLIPDEWEEKFGWFFSSKGDEDCLPCLSTKTLFPRIHSLRDKLLDSFSGHHQY